MTNLSSLTKIKKFKNLYWAYLQLGYRKGQSNEKRITKDYFEFLLHLLFHVYNELVHE